MIDLILSLFFILTNIYVISVTVFYLFYNEKYEVLDNSSVLPVVVSYDCKEYTLKILKELSNLFNEVILLTVKGNCNISNVKVIRTPKNFKSKSIRKGRDILYFCRNYNVKKKWVLFLDEDTKVKFPLLIPKGIDVAMLKEKPKKGNFLVTLCEMQRRSWSFEEKLFMKLNTPFHVWGGGLLVKSKLLKYFPDIESITEDTLFAWILMKKKVVKFGLSETYGENLPPSNLKSLIKQRSRWFIGTIFDLKYCSMKIIPIIVFRLIVWSFSWMIIFLINHVNILITIITYISFTIQNLILCRENDYPLYYSFLWFVGAFINSFSAFISPLVLRKKEFVITEKINEK